MAGSAPASWSAPILSSHSASCSRSGAASCATRRSRNGSARSCGARRRMWMVIARVVMVAGIAPAIPARATGANTGNRSTFIRDASPTHRETVADRLYPEFSRPRRSSLLPPALAEKMVSISSNRSVIGPSASMRKMAAVVMEMVISGFATRCCATSEHAGFAGAGFGGVEDQSGGGVEVLDGVGVGIPERQGGGAMLVGEHREPADERGHLVQQLGGVGDGPDAAAGVAARRRVPAVARQSRWQDSEQNTSSGESASGRAQWAHHRAGPSTWSIAASTGSGRPRVLTRTSCRRVRGWGPGSWRGRRAPWASPERIDAATSRAVQSHGPATMCAAAWVSSCSTWAGSSSPAAASCPSARAAVNTAALWPPRPACSDPLQLRADHGRHVGPAVPDPSTGPLRRALRRP